MAIKKFDSFINENKHSNLNLKELKAEDLSKVIQSVKPGDTLLLRCHWAVSEYAVPKICKSAFRDNFEKIVCGNLSDDTDISSLFKPNKIYLLDEIHRTSDDVLKQLLSAILDNKKSGFIITTTNYDDEDLEFWDMMSDEPSMKDRFTRVYSAN